MTAERVLLVEADPMLRDFLEHYLARHGYAVDVPEDKPQRVVPRPETHYDLVLSNIPKPFSLDAFEAKLELEKRLKRVSGIREMFLVH